MGGGGVDGGRGGRGEGRGVGSEGGEIWMRGSGVRGEKRIEVERIRLVKGGVFG